MKSAVPIDTVPVAVSDSRRRHAGEIDAIPMRPNAKSPGDVPDALPRLPADDERWELEPAWSEHI